MSDFFTNILDSIGYTIRHMGNGYLGGLAVLAIAIVIIGILLLRR